MRQFSRSIVALIFLLAAATLHGHFTWIFPASELQVGQTATIEIGHGHRFPASQAAVRSPSLQAFAVSPREVKSELKMSAAENSLRASYKITAPGLYRFYFVDDRGVMSKTTRGLRSGGRDQHPGALEAYRLYRSAVAYASTASGQNEAPAPVGIEFEMLPEVSGGSITFTVLKDGKPCSGAKIFTGTAADHSMQSLGETDDGGQFVYQPGSAAAGAALFVAEYVEKAPSGADHDEARFTTALSLVIR